MITNCWHASNSLHLMLVLHNADIIGAGEWGFSDNERKGNN